MPKVQLQLTEVLAKRGLSIYRLWQIIDEQEKARGKEKGMSQRGIYDLTEKQPTGITLATLGKICSALGITDMNELLKILPDDR